MEWGSIGERTEVNEEVDEVNFSNLGWNEYVILS